MCKLEAKLCYLSFLFCRLTCYCNLLLHCTVVCLLQGCASKLGRGAVFGKFSSKNFSFKRSLLLIQRCSYRWARAPSPLHGNWHISYSLFKPRREQIMTKKLLPPPTQILKEIYTSVIPPDFNMDLL